MDVTSFRVDLLDLTRSLISCNKRFVTPICTQFTWLGGDASLSLPGTRLECSVSRVCCTSCSSTPIRPALPSLEYHHRIVEAGDILGSHRCLQVEFGFRAVILWGFLQRPWRRVLLQRPVTAPFRKRLRSLHFPLQPRAPTRILRTTRPSYPTRKSFTLRSARPLRRHQRWRQTLEKTASTATTRRSTTTPRSYGGT